MRAILLFLPCLFIIYRLFETGGHIYYISIAIAFMLPVPVLVLKKKERYISCWAGLMISYCLLDHIFKQVSVPELKEQVMHLNYWYMFPSVLLILTGHIVQTFRWSSLLGQVKQLGFFDLFPSMMIGYLVNNLLPAKTGEIVKAWHLGRSKQISKISILATVAVEKVFDGLTILIFLLLSLFILDEHGGKIRALSLAAGSVYIGGLLFLVSLYSYKERLDKVLKEYFSERVSLLISGVTEPFSKGLTIFKDPGQIAKVFFTSFIMWTCTALSLWPVLWMFNFEIPFYTPFFILSFICFGQTMPAAPAGIGIISFASVISLEIIFKNRGVPVTELLYTQFAVFSLIVNAVMVIPEIVIGAYYAITTNMGFKTMVEKSRTET